MSMNEQTPNDIDSLVPNLGKEDLRGVGLKRPELGFHDYEKGVDALLQGVAARAIVELNLEKPADVLELKTQDPKDVSGTNREDWTNTQRYEHLLAVAMNGTDQAEAWLTPDDVNRFYADDGLVTVYQREKQEFQARRAEEVKRQKEEQQRLKAELEAKLAEAKAALAELQTQDGDSGKDEKVEQVQMKIASLESQLNSLEEVSEVFELLAA